MSIPRYILDFRVVGEYRPGKETTSFNGRIFRDNEFPKPKVTPAALLTRATRAIVHFVVAMSNVAAINCGNQPAEIMPTCSSLA